MRLTPSTSIVLRPQDPPVPFDRLMSQWCDARFDAAACRRALDQIIEQRKLPGALFCSEEIERGGRPATDALLYDYFTPDRDWVCLVQTAAQRVGIRVPLDGVPAVAALIRAIEPSRDVEALRAHATPSIYPKLVELLAASVDSSDRPARHGTWPRCEAPGIYRREHASLVIRSRTTTIVVDPQGANLGESSNLGRYPVDAAPLAPDAIAITHHHNDHWHVPSIVQLAGARRVPVIVPVTPRPNLLTAEDFSASLAHIGATAHAMPWWTTTRVGDIEIDALPFFGEQPTRAAPGPADGLRSWGNCYRFTTPDFSALLLVDSGIDPMGSMLDVVERSVAERGPPDVVLSNCRAFPEIINPGLSHYLLALPFERVRAGFLAHDRADVASMTLGESGVAEVCAAARARYFLPYAHMFAGLGVSVDGHALAGVQQRLAELRAATRVVAWDPGDLARIDGTGLGIERAGAPSSAA